MSPRIPGDPGVAGKLAYTLGFRLPERNLEWVRHDLTDADWRWRIALRHMLVLLPISLLFALLPGQVWIRVGAPLFVWLSGMFIVVAYADPIRERRMRQHGLEPPPPRQPWRPTR